jgi:hypothetical protein
MSNTRHNRRVLGVIGNYVKCANSEWILRIGLVFNLMVPWESDYVVWAHSKDFISGTKCTAASNNPDK